MEEIELLDIADELLIVNKTTVERLFQEENQNPLILYLFYYKTAKWQKINPIKADDTYCKRCLHWGIDKLKATKTRLKEMNLIEIIKKVNEKNIITGWYVKVNYLVDNSTIPESTIPISPLVDKQETNTINNNNKILNNNINTRKENIKRKEYFENEELNNLFYEFLEQRKKQKAVNSDRAIKLLLNKLKPYDDDIKKQMIEQSILNSWKGIFEIKEKKESRYEREQRIMKEWLEKDD